MNFMIDATTRSLGETIFNRYSLCDSCIGRLFRTVQKGVSNKEKGTLIRKELHIITEIPTDNCWLCDGLLGEITHFTTLIATALQPYEYTTFLVGSKIDEEICHKEEELGKFLGERETEPIKMEINREIGKILEPQLGKVVDFNNPDIMVVIDTQFDVVSLQIKSLYIYGRYNKFDRTIPQTKWLCSICRGQGCTKCHNTGKLYEISVEELIAEKALEMTGGIGESFHGCGREDIDARMLGSGRPFILEIHNPRQRSFDLKMFENEVNRMAKEKIAVNTIRYAEKSEIERLKSAEFKKVYQVVIEGERPLKKEKVKKAAETLRGATIKQFTPTRVAHRQANKIRERKIYICKVESVEGTIARLLIETDSGTYIKELVSGDNEKTIPNLSGLIGIPCTVKELDVLEIKGD